MQYLITYFERFNLPGDLGTLSAMTVACLIMACLAMLADILARQIIVQIIGRLVARTSTTRDDILVKQRVFERLAHLAPALVVYALVPQIFNDAHPITVLLTTICLIYMVVNATLFFNTLINAGVEIYNSYSIAKEVPLTSFAQVAKLIIYFFSVITILSLLLGKSPLTFLAGLGALTAVLMLVFKDPILGLVAGIQLSANRMVAVGDWIEIPQYDVDGDVMEVALTTVKIRNFDKTITTIPTQSLTSGSFKNWRGMQETGARRIRRAIHIDIDSVKFCDDEMLQRFSKIQYIEAYLHQKCQEIDAYNASVQADSIVPANGRRLTNVGTFRAYIEAYLGKHTQISKSLTFLIRQLKPTEYGLPIEIYVFCLDTDWINYERIQADIMDHLLAATREFDLRIYQRPTSTTVLPRP